MNNYIVSGSDLVGEESQKLKWFSETEHSEKWSSCLPVSHSEQWLLGAALIALV